MNERFIEIAQQASADLDPEEFMGASEVFLEKYAELIVLECAHVAVFNDSGTVATAAVAGHMAAGRSIAATLIKQHFGVEE